MPIVPIDYPLVITALENQRWLSHENTVELMSNITDACIQAATLEISDPILVKLLALKKRTPHIEGFQEFTQIIPDLSFMLCYVLLTSLGFLQCP